jgi:hypothetical protein
MVKSGVAALHVQLCPRNLSRELDLDSMESTTEQPAQRVFHEDGESGAVESGL